MSEEIDNKIKVFLDGDKPENAVVVDSKGNTLSASGLACKETQRAFSAEQVMNSLPIQKDADPILGSALLGNMIAAAQKINPLSAESHVTEEGIMAANSMKVAFSKIEAMRDNKTLEKEVEVDLGNLPPPLTKICEGLEKTYQGKS